MLTGFAGLPLGEITQCTTDDVGVLGVPSEVKTGSRFGTSLAPGALREMAERLDVDLPAKGYDLGNIDLSGDWSGTLMHLVTQMVDRQVVPVVLGGDSDVATAVLEALPDLPVVATMPHVRRDVAARPTNTIWVGLNGEQPIETWDLISQREMIWRTARQLDEGATDIPHKSDGAVLWIDLSVIDMGHAAGVVGLNPGGMKPETLVAVIESMTCSWQAIVITGLAPALDTRGMSELIAIETLVAALRNE
jgi:arginase family enzyme